MFIILSHASDAFEFWKQENTHTGFPPLIIVSAKPQFVNCAFFPTIVLTLKTEKEEEDASMSMESIPHLITVRRLSSVIPALSQKWTILQMSIYSRKISMALDLLFSNLETDKLTGALALTLDKRSFVAILS